jgi:phosphatidylinositol glycan class K
MYSKFYSPNIISTGSSMVGENSYSVSAFVMYGYESSDEQHHNDHDIGVAIIDAYTHFILAYLETIVKTSKATLQDFVRSLDNSFFMR